jgi:hypothetical protein
MSATTDNGDNSTLPPRLTPTQRLHEVTMQALTRAPRTPSESVTISRNAKGDVQIEVTAQSQEGETLYEVQARANSVFVALCSEFDLSRTQTYERNNEPPARVKQK